MSRNVVSIELIGKAGKLLRELDTSSNGVRKFGRVVKGEFAALRRAAGSLQGTLAGIGLSVGAVALTKQSALLDKELTQIGQTAGASKDQVAGLRKELFTMGKDGGAQVEGLKDGFNNLIQAGQSWKASLESTRAINVASGVTGAGSAILAGGLTVGAAAYNIDLEKPGKALELLDKMTAAGRLGNAELENLASIFARVGVNASAAGMDFDKTLAFLETLSMVERNPERLATMADSTLRLFTNLRYMANAQKATGVKFFDAKGERRDAVAVLKDIKTQYDKLGTDKERALYVQKAFGEADLDTIKGLRALLAGSNLDKIGEFSAVIAAAGGTLKRDFGDATDNLIDQTGRMKNTLREAADGFAKPIKDALSKTSKYLLDKKEEGGLGLSGKQLLGGGLAIAGGTALVARYGGTLAKRLLSRGGSVVGGIAEGKAIEAATGVQPIFVTNWPATLGAASMVADQAAGRAAGKVLSAAGLTTKGALIAGGVALLPAFLAVSVGAASRDVGSWLAEKQANGTSTAGLEQLRMQHMVMGGGPDSYQVKLIDEVLSGRNDRTTPVQNDISIGLSIDEQNRLTAYSNDLNTKVNVKRGEF
ncbi:hypothetical protein DSOUD_0872 [Desulfuromonas soudanensis]|uniref:Phage tail tape measure protein domain-containing protein n=1 Tax=Desulfuromonas soudanensis TaxID=1603606 RepID=A0A0M3QF61_9BACT|nr:phage tail tape measure protein [Desulfuromonas soudanensis]ALC15659.1 hypothetical protein DSOUD_0872 [Desulfuromonas soudanensis]